MNKEVLDKIINKTANKEKLAIVVVGYNKVKGLNRLLTALNRASYDSQDVPIVISIDASNNEDVYAMATNYEWQHGTKYVNIEKERLGLKKHIFQCASLSKYFKGVVILEDDILVAPYFYHYCLSTLSKYGDDERVSGIALFTNEYDGFNGLPLQHVNSGYDVFAWQTVCSWGEIWNERMWNAFERWLNNWNEDFGPIDIPRRIKEWERAWSKYVYAYIVENDKYFIFPYESLTTNFNDDGGEHGDGDKSIFQISLLQGKKIYHLGDFDDLVKYDIYTTNKELPQWLGIDDSDLTVDFCGAVDLYKGHYVLTPFNLPYSQIKGFSLSMRPWELNVKYNIKGDDLKLYHRVESGITVPPKRELPLSLAIYTLRGYNFKLMIRYILFRIKKRIKRQFVK